MTANFITTYGFLKKNFNATNCYFLTISIFQAAFLKYNLIQFLNLVSNLVTFKKLLNYLLNLLTKLLN